MFPYAGIFGTKSGLLRVANFGFIFVHDRNYIVTICTRNKLAPQISFYTPKYNILIEDLQVVSGMKYADVHNERKKHLH
jgi:superfamily I DNA and RNA helicase